MALGGVPADSVDLDVPETLPMVHADQGQLERSVANLVENAVKHSPPGTPVPVSASSLADRVEGVVDRGPGVPDEAKERVLAPFQRYGDAPRGAGPGVGLGLAVARGFAEAMGGALTAEDTPGDGPTMVLSLAWARRDRAAEQVTAHVPEAVRREEPPHALYATASSRCRSLRLPLQSAP